MFTKLLYVYIIYIAGLCFGIGCVMVVLAGPSWLFPTLVYGVVSTALLGFSAVAYDAYQRGEKWAQKFTWLF